MHLQEGLSSNQHGGYHQWDIIEQGRGISFFSNKEEIAKAVFERSISIFLPPITSIRDRTLKKSFSNIVNAACDRNCLRLLRAYVLLLPEILLSNTFSRQFKVHFNRALQYNKELIYSFYPHLDSNDSKVSLIVENYLKSFFFLFDGLIIYSMAVKSKNIFDQYANFMEPIFDNLKRDLLRIEAKKPNKYMKEHMTAPHTQ